MSPSRIVEALDEVEDRDPRLALGRCTPFQARAATFRSAKTFVEVGGVVQPAPAPRFSATAPEISRPPAQPGEHTDEILADFGFSTDEIGALHDSGAVAGQ